MSRLVILKQLHNDEKLVSLHHEEDLDAVSIDCKLYSDKLDKLYYIPNPFDDTDDDMYWKNEQNIWRYCKKNDLEHYTLVLDSSTQEKGSGKKCVIPGCKNKCNWIRNVPYGDKLSSPNKFLSVCSYHRYKIISGRIGPNIFRDTYRFHMKDKCEISGFAFKDAYKLSKTTLQNIEGYMFENEPDKKTRILQKREAVKMAMKMFEVDHIDGNHYNNRSDNLQTLTKHAHVIKSSRSGDYNRWRKQ